MDDFLRVASSFNSLAAELPQAVQVSCTLMYKGQTVSIIRSTERRGGSNKKGRPKKKKNQI